MEWNNRKVLLKDIAKHLGVSASTVSMALKDHPDLSTATKEKVKQLAAEWHYNPNPFTNFFLQQRTYTLGVVVPDITNLFYPAIICGIEEEAKAKGYNIVITSSQGSYQKEVECLHKLLKLQVDGLLVCLAPDTTDERHYEKIINANIPLVFFDKSCRTAEVSSVAIDLVEAARDLTIHLYQQGATRIAYLDVQARQYGSSDKLKGYKQGLQACGLSFEEQLLVYAADTGEEVAPAIQALLSRHNPPNAIIGANESVIFPAAKALKQMGLKIPQDIFLGGFTEEFTAKLLEPTLTTMAYPHVEMGKEAARLVLQQIESGKTSVAEQICLKAKLNVRASSTPFTQQV